ncbi:EamA family transporter RarD [Rhizobium sp. SAFR-030]|uniref:EamA family transporter RarD n=1 Tax=Rhizobium sp. SAFR-030 TaxID=3387277 RepID=UPI003F804107
MNIPLGVSLSVLSSVLFGVLYFYATFLQPMDGNEVFGWRMLLILPLITAYVVASGAWPEVQSIVGRARRKPLLFLGLLITSGLIGVQQWLFLWAPMNDAALEVSLGYFLLPLVIVLAGGAIYREKLTALQTLAVSLATIGVVHEFWRVGTLSWETALVALGMAAYFVIRRALGTNTLAGFWLDVMLMSPVALFMIFPANGTEGHAIAASKFLYLLPGLALLSAAAFVNYILASKHLPMSIFGLLGYLEPVLLFIVAFAIGEVFDAEDVFTYVPVMLAVSVLVFEGLLHLKAKNLQPA